MAGLLGTTRAREFPTEEVRFGVVLNGGVSLAVWMGGTVHELDRLTKARERGGRSDPYALLLELAGCTARADVFAGTSAGGINGAALALAQVNRGADLSMLRDLWIEQGRIESLLRAPFQGDPTSLLRGDEYFLPALHDAMTRLAGQPGNRGPEASPIDLTITTTVLRGNQTITLDSMGQQLPQTVFAGLFSWHRSARTPQHDDPFSPGNINRTAAELALASRSTASFPVAFEPSFVPVSSPDFPARAPGTPPPRDTEEHRLRPDMSRVVRSWGERSEGKNSSRFVVDGGVLANTPTLPALEAVAGMEAEGPVRRVMLLVYPHAPSPEEDTPDVAASPPTVFEAVNGLLGALSGQGSRTYVDQLEQHNRRAAGRRGTRSDILRESTSTDLAALATLLYPHYRRLREWRAARDLASRLTGKIDDGATSTALPTGWNFDRVRREAERAQQDWQQDRTLPYVPAEVPAEADLTGWGWGISGALGVADSCNELLRQLVSALGTVDEAYVVATAARRRTFELQASIAAMRKDVDDAWATDRGDDDDAVVGSLSPNRRYWLLRLAYYDHLMVGEVGWAEVRRRITEVAEFEGGLAARTQPPGSPAADAARTIRRDRVSGALTRRLVATAAAGIGLGADAGAGAQDAVLADRAAGAVGGQVAMLVSAVVGQVVHVLHAVDTRALDEQSAPAAEVGRWEHGLGIAPGTSAEVLLTRLLHLEVAATALGDEVSTGGTLPVELVQLSAQTQNRFAEHSRTADDKLGGWSLNRFGGFVKRSWRANDWTWGRLDAATVLCRTVLQPQRVRRSARLSGYLTQGTPERRAADTVAELVVELFGDGAPDLGPLLAEATAELTAVLDPEVDEGDLPAALPALADLFARAVHEQVVVTELPEIATAIRADKVEGGYARSRGEVFLAAEGPLLAKLEAAATGEQHVSPEDRRRALRAFDGAGIGREPLREESSSDLTIRTATTAAAVATTVLSSARSGLSAIAPVTKALRGAMLLPYWVVTGLTSKGGLARNLSLLALALGGTLLALSLFGALPESLSGPATGLGASAVLVAFAYAALRTGTLLHGVVLLSPVIPLLTYSVVSARESDDVSAAQGSTTLLVVIGLALALMLLGSFGAAHGSVFATLDRLADQHGVPLQTRPREGRAPTARSARSRWLEAAVRSAAPVLVGLVVLAALAAVVALALGPDWVQRFRDWSWPGPAKWLLVLLLLAGATVVGVLVAQRGGRDLRVLGRVPAVDEAGTTEVDESGNVLFTWRHQRLANPRGVAVGWSVLYGIVYELLVVALLADPFGTHATWWHRVALLTAVLFALTLVLVVPGVLPVLEYRAVARVEQQRSATVTEPPDYALDLASRGLGYAHYCGAGSAPGLTPAGERLHRGVRQARARATRVG